MSKSYSVRLSSRSVGAIKPTGEEFDVRDVELKGFHVRVTRAGSMMYRYQYARPDGARPVVTLGRTSELTADQARALAVQHAVAVRSGGDPAKAKSDWKAAPTMDDLWDRYDREQLTVKNKPRTQAEYRRNWRKHSKPYLGSLKVADVSRADVRRAMNALGDKHTTANRVRALISVLMGFAIEHELRSDNPVTGIKKYRENVREDVFTDDELARIGAAVEVDREPWARIAMKLLILTGARVSEVLGAEWKEFDLEDASPAWRIPAARMKGGKNHTYHLDADTAALVAQWKEDATVVSPTWLFPNLTGKGPKSSLKDPWARVKSAAKITRGVLHSFRHTFFTRLAEGGASATDIQAIAGHADIATSMKYVHAAETKRLRLLQEENRQAIRGALTRGPKVQAEVVGIGDSGRRR